MERYPIYTEINNCRDCYRCVRHCPVKAIQIRDAHAEIIYERCTFCGTCVNECPNSVKVIRNDIDRVEMAFLSKRKVIVSLAPSYVSEFRGYEENFVRALYRLGFHAVSETAIGAALVTEALDIYMDEHGIAPFISTACPSRRISTSWRRCRVRCRLTARISASSTEMISSSYSSGLV